MTVSAITVCFGSMIWACDPVNKYAGKCSVNINPIRFGQHEKYAHSFIRQFCDPAMKAING
jgi:hypothetical protein